MRYYLSTMGSTCYDKTGITFPKKKKISLKKIVASFGGYDFKWENQFGWDNQPEVLTFKTLQNDLNPVTSRELNEALFDLGLTVYGKNWE